MATLNDGLGFEELVLISGAALPTQNAFLTGSITAGDQISGTNIYANALVKGANVIGATAVSGAAGYFTNAVASTLLSGTGVNTAIVSGTNLRFDNAVVNGSVNATGGFIYPGTVNGQGIIVNNFPAETIITGGMWTVGSAASGTTPVYVVKAAAASESMPLGICLANTASGTATKPNILTRGLYKGLIADGTIAVGAAISAGAGAALNTAIKATTGSNIRGFAVMGAGSEGVMSVYLL